MNTYLSQSLAQDHIKESRQQAATDRQASAARSAQRRTHARRAGYRLVRGA